MKNPWINLWRALCVANFITGVVSFSQTPVKDDDKVEQAVPYTVITASFRVSADGTKSVVGERIRYVKSNGEWRETRHDRQGDDSSNNQDKAGKQSVVYASTDEGVFAKSPDYADRKFISQPAGRRSVALIKVAGLKL